MGTQASKIKTKILKPEIVLTSTSKKQQITEQKQQIIEQKTFLDKIEKICLDKIEKERLEKIEYERRYKIEHERLVKKQQEDFEQYWREFNDKRFREYCHKILNEKINMSFLKEVPIMVNDQKNSEILQIEENITEYINQLFYFN